MRWHLRRVNLIKLHFLKHRLPALLHLGSIWGLFSEEPILWQRSIWRFVDSLVPWHCKFADVILNYNWFRVLFFDWLCRTKVIFLNFWQHKKTTSLNFVISYRLFYMRLNLWSNSLFIYGLLSIGWLWEKVNSLVWRSKISVSSETIWHNTIYLFVNRQFWRITNIFILGSQSGFLLNFYNFVG